ncbi:hypothetical protein [Vibrio rumoiensis]|uniref:Uncharacterized protein n=1 Tax=Vibrio rumoiensis 1S-45 TaxID=1188252 RepID=A0A1E5E4C0_9VIBR|nr:hypothetical protein [Vibrio rumoiensis]OEF26988.1 hypothetical protein A1QC_01070 [Vibrio rumoiensis 1S-45]
MAKIGLFIQACLAAAIFYLGFTIYSFTNTVNKVVETYPTMLADFNQTTANLDIKGWLDVANKYAEIAPKALQVVQDMNSTVAGVNKTVASVDTKLPQVLAEMNGLRTQTVPAVLKESALIRQELPPMLTKIDQIVEKSEEISKNATEGAVKGIILSPVNLLKDAGKGLKSTVTE